MTQRTNPKKRKYQRRKDGVTPKRKSYDRDQFENLMMVYAAYIGSFIWAVFIEPDEPKADNSLVTTGILAMVVPYLANVKLTEMLRSIKSLVVHESDNILRDINHTLLITMSVAALLSIMFIVDMSFMSKVGYSIGGVAGSSIFRALYIRIKMG